LEQKVEIYKLESHLDDDIAIKLKDDHNQGKIYKRIYKKSLSKDDSNLKNSKRTFKDESKFKLRKTSFEVGYLGVHWPEVNKKGIKESIKFKNKPSNLPTHHSKKAINILNDIVGDLKSKRETNFTDSSSNSSNIANEHNKHNEISNKEHNQSSNITIPGAKKVISILDEIAGELNYNQKSNSTRINYKLKYYKLKDVLIRKTKELRELKFKIEALKLEYKSKLSGLSSKIQNTDKFEKRCKNRHNFDICCKGDILFKIKNKKNKTSPLQHISKLCRFLLPTKASVLRLVEKNPNNKYKVYDKKVSRKYNNDQLNNASLCSTENLIKFNRTRKKNERVFY
jgi:hypothetical protein